MSVKFAIADVGGGSRFTSSSRRQAAAGQSGTHRRRSTSGELQSNETATTNNSNQSSTSPVPRPVRRPETAAVGFCFRSESWKAIFVLFSAEAIFLSSGRASSKFSIGFSSLRRKHFHFRDQKPRRDRGQEKRRILWLQALDSGFTENGRS